MYENTGLHKMFESVNSNYQLIQNADNIIIEHFFLSSKVINENN